MEEWREIHASHDPPAKQGLRMLRITPTAGGVHTPSNLALIILALGSVSSDPHPPVGVPFPLLPGGYFTCETNTTFGCSPNPGTQSPDGGSRIRKLWRMGHWLGGVRIGVAGVYCDNQFDRTACLRGLVTEMLKCSFGRYASDVICMSYSSASRGFMLNSLYSLGWEDQGIVSMG